MEVSKKNNDHYEVVERYCPKRGENVVMKRTFGSEGQLKCMNYESCSQSKDEFCEVKNSKW